MQQPKGRSGMGPKCLFPSALLMLHQSYHLCVIIVSMEKNIWSVLVSLHTGRVVCNWKKRVPFHGYELLKTGISTWEENPQKQTHCSKSLWSSAMYTFCRKTNMDMLIHINIHMVTSVRQKGEPHSEQPVFHTCRHPDLLWVPGDSLLWNCRSSSLQRVSRTLMALVTNDCPSNKTQNLHSS